MLNDLRRSVLDAARDGLAVRLVQRILVGTGYGYASKGGARQLGGFALNRGSIDVLYDARRRAAGDALIE